MNTRESSTRIDTVQSAASSRLADATDESKLTDAGVAHTAHDSSPSNTTSVDGVSVRVFGARWQISPESPEPEVPLDQPDREDTSDGAAR